MHFVKNVYILSHLLNHFFHLKQFTRPNPRIYNLLNLLLILWRATHSTDILSSTATHSALCHAVTVVADVVALVLLARSRHACAGVGTAFIIVARFDVFWKLDPLPIVGLSWFYLRFFCNLRIWNNRNRHLFWLWSPRRRWMQRRFWRLIWNFK